MGQLMACGLNSTPVSSVYSGRPFEGCPDIASVMPQGLFNLLLKHFRFVDPTNLPQKNEEGFHPLQNIRKGIQYVKERSLLLWKAGLCTKPFFKQQCST